MQIIENFLEDNDFNEIQQLFLSRHFPWFFYEKSLEHDQTHFQFTHQIFTEHTKFNYYGAVEKLVQKLNPTSIHRIKANLTTKTPSIIETGLHIDLDKDFTSALFFINDCDGYCRFGDKKITSKQNRLVKFKSNILHTGSTCTDQDRRVVINVIYTE